MFQFHTHLHLPITTLRQLIARTRYSFLFLLPILLFFTACAEESVPVKSYEPFVLTGDGGWCWFQDPRVVAHGDHVVIASVANGGSDTTRTGDVDAIVYNLATQEATVSTLTEQFQANDHATPAFLVRPDNRWLTIYTRHGNDNHLFHRISEPGNPTTWSTAQTYTPSESTRITYSNPYMLEAENNRIYNFFRGLDNSWKPSYVYSDDLGESWHTGNIFIEVPAEERHRPYVRYRSNGVDKIHMIYTEGHPRNYNNSIYHIVYHDGKLLHSDGTPVSSLEEGLSRPEEGTRIYKGSPDNVAWTTDIVLDDAGQPRIVFSVKMNATEQGIQEHGEDQRYYYGRWDGVQWHVSQMAYAGSKLYPGEDEYTGLAAIDPRNPDIVYISADADPDTGDPLISEANGQRHYEIFRGETTNSGTTWQWTPVTQNSTADNLRPVAADGLQNGTFLAWLRGEYRTYTDYDQEVVGLLIED